MFGTLGPPVLKLISLNGVNKSDMIVSMGWHLSTRTHWDSTQRSPNVLDGSEWSRTPRRIRVRADTDPCTLTVSQVELSFGHWPDTLIPRRLLALGLVMLTVLFSSPLPLQMFEWLRIVWLEKNKIIRSNNMHNSFCLLSPYCMPGTVMTLVLQLRGPKVVTVQGYPLSKGQIRDMNAGLADPKAHVAGQFCILVYKCIWECCLVRFIPAFKITEYHSPRRSLAWAYGQSARVWFGDREEIRQGPVFVLEKLMSCLTWILEKPNDDWLQKPVSNTTR